MHTDVNTTPSKIDFSLEVAVTSVLWTFFGGFLAATTNSADMANFRRLGGLICSLEETLFVPSQKCPYHVTFDLNLDLDHTLDAGSPVDHRVQAWSQSTICLRKEAILGPAQKCRYHVIFDLDLDFEHRLDAASPVDHRLQVFFAIGPFACEKKRF